MSKENDRIEEKLIKSKILVEPSKELEDKIREIVEEIKAYSANYLWDRQKLNRIIKDHISKLKEIDQPYYRNVYDARFKFEYHKVLLKRIKPEDRNLIFNDILELRSDSIMKNDVIKEKAHHYKDQSEIAVEIEQTIPISLNNTSIVITTTKDDQKQNSFSDSNATIENALKSVVGNTTQDISDLLASELLTKPPQITIQGQSLETMSEQRQDSFHSDINAVIQNPEQIVQNLEEDNSQVLVEAQPQPAVILEAQNQDPANIPQDIVQETQGVPGPVGEEVIRIKTDLEKKLHNVFIGHANNQERLPKLVTDHVVELLDKYGYKNITNEFKEGLQEHLRDETKRAKESIINKCIKFIVDFIGIEFFKKKFEEYKSKRTVKTAIRFTKEHPRVNHTSHHRRR